jgi:hypothetical protein
MLDQLAGGLMWIALVGFSRRFLDTKRSLPRYDMLWNIPVIILVASLLLGFMNVRVWNVFAYLGDCLPAPLGIVGNRSARWFLIAQVILGLGILLQTAFDFDLLDPPRGLWFNLLSAHTAWLASLVEAVLFSFALASRPYQVPDSDGRGSDHSSSAGKRDADQPAKRGIDP